MRPWHGDTSLPEAVDRRGTWRPIRPLTVMGIVLRKPAVIAAVIAAVSVAILLVVNHTYLIIDRRPPPTPPGTTFNAAKDAGADVTPTPPESPIKLTPAGPTPVQPASPAK
jgi:hypothetical protein